MPITKQARQVLWAGGVTVSVAAGGAATSDAITPGQDAVGAILQVKADNTGTPAAGDTLDVYLLMTAGDPDADPDTADEYDTINHGLFLMRLDTSADDPALKSVEIPTAMKAYQVRVVNNGASAMTVSAQVYEQNAA